MTRGGRTVRYVIRIDVTGTLDDLRDAVSECIANASAELADAERAIHLRTVEKNPGPSQVARRLLVAPKVLQAEFDRLKSTPPARDIHGLPVCEFDVFGFCVVQTYRIGKRVMQTCARCDRVLRSEMSRSETVASLDAMSH